MSQLPAPPFRAADELYMTEEAWPRCAEQDELDLVVDPGQAEEMRAGRSIDDGGRLTTTPAREPGYRGAHGAPISSAKKRGDFNILTLCELHQWRGEAADGPMRCITATLDYTYLKNTKRAVSPSPQLI